MNTSSMNRPVTSTDIAVKLGKSISSVRFYLGKKGKVMNTPTSILVNNTAKEMGYDPKAAYAYGGNLGGSAKCNHGTATCECGAVFNKTSNRQKYCTACQIVKQRENQKKWAVKNGLRTENWRGGNFKTREEEVARMKELRAMGYSNPEIAKMIGRDVHAVLRNIGKQDPELAKQNVAMAAHIRAQKNAARKQYMINKPIREYNAKVEQHNKMKAELNMLQLELLEQKPAIEQTAQTKIDFPLVDLRTVQPTALQ